MKHNHKLFSYGIKHPIHKFAESFYEEQKRKLLDNPTELNKMEKLEKGAEFLSGNIGGKDGISIALFPNTEKKSDNEPDYRGTISVALWNSVKK